MGHKKFLGMGYEKFPRKSPAPTKLLPLCSSQKFLNGESYPGISLENLRFLSTFSVDISVKDSSEFPRFPEKDSWELPQIFRKILTWAMFPGPNYSLRFLGIAQLQLLAFKSRLFILFSVKHKRKNEYLCQYKRSNRDLKVKKHAVTESEQLHIKILINKLFCLETS